MIVLLSFILLFTPHGSTVFSLPSSSVNPFTLALTANSSFNDNHQSLQPPPVANARANQVVTSGSTVILNGSSSRAPNGIILSYSWKQIPTDAQTTLSGANTPVWEFTAPNVNTDTLLRFQLNVTDNLGQVGTALVNVIDKPVAQPSTQIMKSPFTAVHLLPKLKTVNTDNTSNTLPTTQAKLYMVKITSPIKSQQIPVSSKFTVSGTSVANSMSAYCQVSVIVNGIKPYQKVFPTGHGGANDYSTWSYTLIPAYTVIKQGQNKITAKFSCSDNPSLLSHNSVNITGVANSNAAVIAAGSEYMNNTVNCRLYIYSPGPCS
jgi:hypothetical protein